MSDRRQLAADRQRRYRRRLAMLQTVVPVPLNYRTLTELSEALQREGFLADDEISTAAIGAALGEALNSYRLAFK